MMRAACLVSCTLTLLGLAVGGQLLNAATGRVLWSRSARRALPREMRGWPLG
jgi:hypothetical protein